MRSDLCKLLSYPNTINGNIKLLRCYFTLCLTLTILVANSHLYKQESKRIRISVEIHKINFISIGSN